MHRCARGLFCCVPMQSRQSVSDIWGPRTPHFQKWPARIDQNTKDDPERWVQSTCLLCSTGCAVDIGVRDGHMVGVRGREADRVNRGRLGPKGLYGWQANHHPDRLKRPLVRMNGELREATWDEALERVVEKLKDTREKYTPGAIGFYNSGQLLLEEYYALAILGDLGI